VAPERASAPAPTGAVPNADMHKRSAKELVEKMNWMKSWKSWLLQLRRAVLSMGGCM